MNLYKAIEYLYTQKETLERVIASLEEVQRSGAPSAAVVPSALERRGRKSMSSAEREEVSRRMKKYWASRREHESAAPDLSIRSPRP